MWTFYRWSGLAFRAFVTLLKVNLGQKLWLFLEFQPQKIKSRWRLKTFFEKWICWWYFQRLDIETTAQFSKKKKPLASFMCSLWWHVLRQALWQRSWVLVRWFHPPSCHIHVFYTIRICFLSTNTAENLSCSFSRRFYITEAICSITSNKSHRLSPPPHSRTSGSLLWPSVCNLLLRITNDPNNLSSSKTQIFLLDRTPRDCHYLSEGVRKQVFYLFNGSSFQKLGFTSVLRLPHFSFLLRLFFVFLNPVPSLFRNNQLWQVSQSQDPFSIAVCFFFFLAVIHHN